MHAAEHEASDFNDLALTGSAPPAGYVKNSDSGSSHAAMPQGRRFVALH
jgi:hypothetical protein